MDKKGYTFNTKKRNANSCCNTNTDVTMFEYLVSEESQILPYTERAKQINDIAILYSRIYKGSTIRCKIPSSIIEKHRTILPMVFQSTIQALFNKYKADIETGKIDISLPEEIDHKYTVADFNNFLKKLYASHLGTIYPISELLTKEVFNASSMIKYFTDIYSQPIKVTSPKFIIPKQYIDQLLSIGSMYITPITNTDTTSSGLSQFRTFLQSGITQMYKKLSTLITSPQHISIINKLNPKKISYIFDHFLTPSMLVSELLQWLKNITCIIPNMIIHTKNNPGIIKMNLSSTHINDIYNIVNEKYILIAPIQNPLLRSVFSELFPSLNQFMEMVQISLLFCKKYMNIETTVMIIKYYVYFILVYLLEPPAITNTEYSQRQIQSDMLKYVGIVVNILTTNIQKIDKKLITLNDDNILIKNTEKNNMLKEMENLNKDEQVSNKILKQLKLKRWATPTNLRKYSKSGYDADEKITYDETELPDDIDIGDITDDIEDINDSSNLYNYSSDVNVSGNNINFDDDADVGDNVNWEFDRDYMDSNEGENYNDDEY